MSPSLDVTVGVLALQGAFNEHVQLLRQAAQILAARDSTVRRRWTFAEIRTAAELAACDALIIPGGESTTMSLVAQRSGVLEPLRDFVK
jgi:5'-phosphate synthase pdxT subunit